MIQKHDRSDRRFLTFPAVHPCSAVSPATLLDSLITLSCSICSYQSKFFPTQRKIAREALRQVAILLIFFEEIQERGRPNLSNSAVLCFSELHLALQKVLFLLQDCTKEGARLRALTKAGFIATQFRVSIRTVATVLDVLPLRTIDVSCEVKELIELVAKQARKAKLEIDPDDETAMNRVTSILDGFGNRLEPDRRSVEPVLDYLEIRSWNECQSEIRFLDDEISLQYLDGNERELPLLSSLVGFMCYCRGVLFETGAYGTFDQTDRMCNLETIRFLNPEDFRCPISLELMTDPVTVSTGQTYDRVSIQKWLQAGNLLCPKTGEILSNTELVPNSALRKLIQQFCVDNGVSLSKSRKMNRDITRTIVAGSPSAAEAIKFLSEFISNRLYFGTEEQKNRAAYETRLLAKSNIFNRSCLVESGTVPPLLNLLNSTDPSVQENSISALLKLSKHSSGKKAIVENGGLKPILRVLKNGLKLENRQISAATFFYLSSVHEYRKLIGSTPGAIQALADLIKDGTNCGKKNAVVAIFGLLLHHSNHQRVLSAGLVPILVNILASSSVDDLVTDSLAVLATLAESVEGSVSILQTSPLPIVISTLQSSTSRGRKEYCVSILLYLCKNCGGDAMSDLARNHPSLMPLLFSLTADGTSHASKKAWSLIRMLHNFQETSSSGLKNSAVPQERFIHIR